MSFAELLLQYIKEKGYTATRLFSLAKIDRFFGYDILSGSKFPDRDQAIRLAVALGLSQEETQSILLDYGYPTLDNEDERDSIILFAIKQGGDIDSINEALANFDFDIL